MACVPLTSLMNTIQVEFLQATPPVILDEHTAHITNSLYQNLGFLLAFLEELVKKPGTDRAAIKDLEAEIRDFAFSAEDEIESNLTNIYMAVADKEMILSQNLRQVAEDTQEFVNRIKSQYYDSAVQDLPEVNTLLSNLGSVHESGSSQEFSKTLSKMVGRRNELIKIMDQLTRQPSGNQIVIPIIGMGGIGKTTLARRVYEDPLVISHFDVRAWTTVSQEVNVRRVLCDLLSSIEMATKMDINGSTSELANQLRRCLMGRRYLIVVDDVWETSLWDFLARCFPKSYGSAVLVTTRLKEIANYTTSGTNHHNLHFLDSNESWDLFRSHIFLKDPLPSKLETIGRNIVDMCRGLPLAIVVAAGLVSQLNKADELETIEEEISYLVSTDLGEQCSKILALSYNHLPQHLKACFLYLGVFSKNSEIPVKKLVGLWMGEGFVKPVGDKELEEVAVGYLKDLVSRSLVLIDKLKSDGQIKTCRMHDLVRGLCVQQATDENLLYDEDNSNEPIGACRWLSFRSSKPEQFDVCNNSKKARSVLCLNNDEMPLVNEPKPVMFSLLRALDLTSPLYNKGVYVSFTDLTYLVLLRYLAFMFDRSLGFTGLENVLSRNQKLQTLIVSHSAASWQAQCSHLPSTIWGSPQLRHLEFKTSFRVEPPSTVKENLQSLYWLSIFHCSVEVFSRIPNIKKLGIFCEGRLIPDDGESWYGTNNLENLCHLNQLEALTIEAEYAIPKRMSLPGIASFPCNLRKLKLSKTYLPWKDIATIALLPVLEVLKLKMDAFYGSVWEPTEAGFPRLKFLLLEYADLVNWDASDDEFPVLERLVLKRCQRLRLIPSTFSYVNSLQSIDLDCCSISVMHSAKDIQEEQINYGNDSFVVIDRTPQYTKEQRMLYDDSD